MPQESHNNASLAKAGIPTNRLFVLLTALGLVINLVPLAVGYGVHLLLGSIPVMLLAHLYGTRHALFAGIVAAIPTFFIWHHPYAIIIFGLEAAFVSYLHQRQRIPAYFSDGIYWLILGVPLVCIFYRLIMGVAWDDVLLIALKQSLNGLLNAILASFLLRLYYINLHNSAPHNYRFTLGENVTEAVFLTSAIGLLIMLYVVMSGHTEKQVRDAIDSDLSKQAAIFSKALQQRIEQFDDPLTELELRRQAIEVAAYTNTNLYIVDQQYNPIEIYHATEELRDRSPKFKLRSSGNPGFVPLSSNGAAVQKWKLSIAVNNIDMARLDPIHQYIVAISVSSEIEAARKITLNSLATGLALLFMQAWLAFLIGRMQANPFRAYVNNLNDTQRLTDDILAPTHAPEELASIDRSLKHVLKQNQHLHSAKQKYKSMLHHLGLASPVILFKEKVGAERGTEREEMYIGQGFGEQTMAAIDTECGSIFDLLSNKDRFITLMALQEAVAIEEPVEIDHQVKLPGSNSSTWLRFFLMPTLEHDETVSVTGLAIDVKKEYELRAQLQEESLYDPLTFLGNSQWMMRNIMVECADAWKAGQAVVVYLFYIAHHQDAYAIAGEEAGDQLILHLVKRLKQLLGENSKLARPNPNQLVIFQRLPLDIEAVESFATRALIALQHPIHLQGCYYGVSAQCGISFHEFHAEGDQRLSSTQSTFGDALLKGELPQKLYYKAEKALNCAITQGERYHIHDDEFALQDLEHSRIRHSLFQALAQDELYLEYQPQVALNGGKPVQMEALLRWHHPEKGYIAPSVFIPIAEQAGLLKEIGRWVLHEALQMMCKNFPNHNIGLSINASIEQLKEPDFATEVAVELAYFNYPHNQLEIELTGSDALIENGNCRKNIDTLKMMGVKIVLDDYGNGYATAKQLATLGFAKIKLDKALVDELPASASARQIFTSTLQIAQHHCNQVVVKGVGTAEQLEFISQFSDLLVQGSIFSNPL